MPFTIMNNTGKQLKAISRIISRELMDKTIHGSPYSLMYDLLASRPWIKHGIAENTMYVLITTAGTFHIKICVASDGYVHGYKIKLKD